MTLEKLGWNKKFQKAFDGLSQNNLRSGTPNP